MAWLLARRNVDVFVLDGGYRAYRLHLRDLLEPGPRVIGVSGRTRSGKTRVLLALAAKNLQVLDLEALAAPRGSAFGALKGAAQPSNAAFETKCAWAWRALDPRRHRGRGGPRRLVPRAPGALRAHAGGAARRRVGRRARGALLEDYAEDEAAEIEAPATEAAEAEAPTGDDEDWLNTVWTQVDDMVQEEEFKLQELTCRS